MTDNRLTAARAAVVATALASDPSTDLTVESPRTKHSRLDKLTQPKLWGVIEPNRGTIRNLRPKLRRNLKVSIQGIVAKFKKFVNIHRLSVPNEVRS